jgi:hypothetical protein
LPYPQPTSNIFDSNVVLVFLNQLNDPYLSEQSGQKLFFPSRHNFVACRILTDFAAGGFGSTGCQLPAVLVFILVKAINAV